VGWGYFEEGIIKQVLQKDPENIIIFGGKRDNWSEERSGRKIDERNRPY